MPTQQEITWYDEPLYYDIVFDEDTEGEASFLEAMHERHGRGGKKRRAVLEVACGSGRLVENMAARGWSTAGFDANPATLKFARDRLRQTGEKATLWQDRMENFKVPRDRRFDLAHCLVSTFKYLPSEADAVSCLKRVAGSLHPGGIFVLGIHLTDYSNPRITHERWVAERDGIEVVCNTRTWPADRRRRTEKVRSRIRARHPGGKEVQQETIWTFRTYSAAQVRRMVRGVPELCLVACHDFYHDPESGRELDDSYADVVLVLRRG
ncbi:class I SAM-dependent methyltransferase [Verrucomicrobiales bacterium]|nr:class I SAM-dependent methyltransferase [Verrucomicrobiales bacterium]